MIVLLTLLTSVGRPAPAGAAMLGRLHDLVVHRSDKKAWFQRFERELPAANIPKLQRIQKQAKSYSRAYAECSFALAYYGVDYSANLQRVLRPNTVWSKSWKQYNREYPEIGDGVDFNCWGNIGEALNLLYLKHHDLQSLGAWLEMPTDGAPAEGNDIQLADLWQRHRADMLEAACGNTRRIGNLAEALELNVLAEASAKAAVLRNQIAKLKVPSGTQDHRIWMGARQLDREIARIEHQRSPHAIPPNQ